MRRPNTAQSVVLFVGLGLLINLRANDVGLIWIGALALCVFPALWLLRSARSIST